MQTYNKYLKHPSRDLRNNMNGAEQNYSNSRDFKNYVNSFF